MILLERQTRIEKDRQIYMPTHDQSRPESAQKTFGLIKVIRQIDASLPRKSPVQTRDRLKNRDFRYVIFQGFESER
jgi:hypothetical protein